MGYRVHEGGWKMPANFAKSYVSTYNNPTRKVGVTKQQIYRLIKEEIDKPGSTGLDILEVDGVRYVRHASLALEEIHSAPLHLRNVATQELITKKTGTSDHPELY